jgi:hypothetical protein
VSTVSHDDLEHAIGGSRTSDATEPVFGFLPLEHLGRSSSASMAEPCGTPGPHWTFMV